MSVSLSPLLTPPSLLSSTSPRMSNPRESERGGELMGERERGVGGGIPSSSVNVQNERMKTENLSAPVRAQSPELANSWTVTC